MAMTTPGIDQLLGELRATASRAAGREAAAPAGEPASFADLLKASVDQVGAAQQRSEQLQAAYEADSPDVNVQDVMISLQKANLSFQTMVQVRNRLVSAYQEIMNVQV
jgi:flagellar hook-basal body complex protein FliE